MVYVSSIVAEISAAYQIGPFNHVHFIPYQKYGFAYIWVKHSC